MRYKLLGRSGLRVSEICLGGMTFGEAWGWGASTSETARVFDCFLDAGGNFIDTANIYTDGQSESMLGEMVTAARRDRVVIATKYGDAKPGVNDPNASGNHRKNMVQSVEASLKRLNTDRIDILFIHTWDFTTRPDEVMRALDDLVRQGKILYPGISDAPAWVISRCNELADHRGWSPFIVNQIEYSLLERTAERDILPMSRALDIGVVAWAPLAGGMLTGKYTSKKNATNEKKRFDATDYNKPMSPRNLAIARELDQVADDIGTDPAVVALAWVLAHGVIPIVGVSRQEQLVKNLAFLDLTLSPEHLARLDAASLVELGFPHDFMQVARHFVYGGMMDQIHRHRDEGLGTGYGYDMKKSAFVTDFDYTKVMVNEPK